jgi:hypothetical protein
MKKFRQQPSVSKRQRGLVLLITLLVLIAMMLASVGIMRSVDTSVAAMSNMAFKQAADEAAGTAIQQVLQNIMPNWSTGLVTNSAFLDNDGGGAGAGYYASIQPNESAQGIPQRLRAQPPVNDAGFFLNGPDGAGNMIRIMVERMCNVDGAANSTICLGQGGPARRDPIHHANAIRRFELPGGGRGFRAYYRVSVRVDGPNNTVSYAQSVILL